MRPERSAFPLLPALQRQPQPLLSTAACTQQSTQEGSASWRSQPAGTEHPTTPETPDPHADFTPQVCSGAKVVSPPFPASHPVRKQKGKSPQMAVSHSRRNLHRKLERGWGSKHRVQAPAPHLPGSVKQGCRRGVSSSLPPYFPLPSQSLWPI